jgi:hypothetical protein
MISRIESTAKRAAARAGVFLLATFVVGIIVGILTASNLVWGEDNQYGFVKLPGKKVLHLPARDIDVSLAVHILGKGNETVDVPIPSRLALSVVPTGDSPRVDVTRDLGASTNANADGVNSQRRVWRIHVPADGDYRVTARGRYPGGGVNAQLWFGHGPPLSGGWPYAVAALLVAAGWGIQTLVRSRRRVEPGLPPKAQPAGHGAGPAGSFAEEAADFSERAAAFRKQAEGFRASSEALAGTMPAKTSGAEDSDPVDRLERLAALHHRGDLTDEEFAAEKAKILGSG